MPSPTDRTWPISETSASLPKSLIWFLRIAEISAARISILADSLHRDLEVLELGLERIVDHARADLDDQAAEDGRVGAGGELDIASDRLPERRLEFGDVAGG